MFFGVCIMFIYDGENVVCLFIWVLLVCRRMMTNRKWLKGIA